MSAHRRRHGAAHTSVGTAVTTAARTRRSERRRRSAGVTLRLAVTATLATLGLVTPAVPAMAAGTVDAGDVLAAITDPSHVGGTLTLDQNVDASDHPDLVLPAGQSLAIDLAGHTLTLAGLTGPFGTADQPDGLGGVPGLINKGTLVVTDGTLHLVGGDGGAGFPGAGGAPGLPGGSAPSSTDDGADGGMGDPGQTGGFAGAGAGGLINQAGATLVLSGVTTTVTGGGGGDGGNGGDGGPGGAGGDGGLEGTGGDGGPGGEGGDGGFGGHGGLGLANDGTIVTAGGSLTVTPGSGGPAGPAGAGGPGGHAGGGGTPGQTGVDGPAGDPGTAGTDGTTWAGAHRSHVTLDGHGADAPSAVTVYTDTVGHALGSLADLPPDAAWPTRSGSTLDGWYTTKTGGTEVDENSAISASDQTIYAHWTPAAQTCNTTVQQAFNGAADGDTVTLTCDVTIAADDNLPLAVASDASITLDLAGYALTVAAPELTAGIAVPGGAGLTIADSVGGGSITATGGDYAAGIGGNDSAPAGDVTISGGTVTANGGASAAGIGGGQNSAGSVTISGGTVTAYGGDNGAGIGGGNQNAGTVTISNGTVTAVGGANGAGIGSGPNSPEVDAVTISGGTVTATGGDYAAGIGGGQNVDGGAITISGGTVTASGGTFGAGIGGGAGYSAPGGDGGTIHLAGGATVTAIGGPQSGTTFDGGAGIGGGAGIAASLHGGDGADLTIDAGAAVTVSSADGSATAIGGGGSTDGGTVGAFGSLDNAGTLTIQSGSAVTIPSAATVHNSGTIHNAGTIDGAGTLDGSGTITNTGAIWYTVTVGSGQTVTGHHYELAFDSNGGGITWHGAAHGAWSILDGPTLASVGRSTADLMSGSRSGYIFDGWNTEVDGSGDTVTDTSTFAGSSTDGTPVSVPLYAQWTTDGPASLHAYPNGSVSSGATSCPVTSDLAQACDLSGALDLAGSGDTVVLEADPGSEQAVFGTTTGWQVPQDSLTITSASGVDVTLDGQHQAVSVLAYSGTGTLQVSGLTVANSAGSADTSTPGGGIVNKQSGTLHVVDSTFSGNTVTSSRGYGGGIVNWSYDGRVTATGSTFIGNDVRSNGTGTGGGIFNASAGSVLVVSSTFADNTIDGGRGGGVLSVTGQVTAIASTFVGNTGGEFAYGVRGAEVTLAASLLAGNGSNCDAAVTDAGYNISDDDSCGFTQQSSITGSAGLAVTLNRPADNGGPTRTLMPFDVSAAVGMIPTGTSVPVGGDDVQLCATTDQRGTPSSGACNAGSVQGSVTAECTTTAGFAAIFDAAADGDTVSLCGDIAITAADRLPLVLASGESVTLDLAGHTLDVTAPADHAGMGVPADTALIITDSTPAGGGTLHATGGGSGAGIGTDTDDQDSGTVTITSGTVVAASAYWAGAGIGGGASGPDLTIGAAADVTVSGGDGVAIGSRTGLGTIQNSGLLTLPAGESIDLNGGTLTNDGTVHNAGTIAGPGGLDGTGTVENAGAITHTVAIGAGQTVTDHHYALHFDAGAGSLDWAGASPWRIVTGPSVASVGYATTDLPAATRDGFRFTGWYLDPGASGTAIDAGTALSAESSTDGTPVAVPLYAGWTAEVALHAYPNGAADSPASCPVVTDLTDACTLTQALDLAQNQDSIVLEADPGTGSEATFSTTTGWTVAQDTLTIRSADGVRATLDGQHQAPYVLNDTGTGTLTVANLTVANSVGSTMTSGGGGAPVRTIGGGIAVSGGGDLSVTGSTFTGNTAHISAGDSGSVGGGIVNGSIFGGTAGGVAGGGLTVTDSTFVGNTTANDNGQLAYGGGILNVNGTVAVRHSTFTGNDTTATGTAVFAVGGGVVNISGAVTIVASTVVDNAATGDAGTIYGGGLIGAAGPTTVVASVFAGAGPACTNPTGPEPIIDGGYNIADDSSCGFTESSSVTDSTGLAATLNALADNGGPTDTIAPKPGSPVIDMIPAGTSVTVGAASVALCPTTDQRGVASAPGAACHAGSVQSAGPLVVTTTALPDGLVDAAYQAQRLTATGGYGGGTWALSQGALPDGLTISDSGVLSGTPRAAGTFAFTVQVTDNATFTATRHLSITVIPAVCTTAPFTDVRPGDPNCEYITWMVDRGITSGFPDRTYRPAKPATRQAMAAFLYRLHHGGDHPQDCDQAPFTDVPTDNPFCGAIDWLKDRGATDGYGDGSFHPTQVVTNQTLAAFLYRLEHDGASAPDCTADPYGDVPKGSLFCGAIAWAKDEGIVIGTNDQYQPLAIVTRGSVAPVLFRYDIVATDL